MTQVAHQGSANDVESLGPVLDFLRLLWRVNHGMERRSRQMHARLGITAQQRIAIRLIGRFPDTSASQLAALLHVDPGTLSSLLSRLEQGQLIRRVPDAEDGRRVRISLTARGRRHDHEESGTLEQAVTDILARVPKHELAGAQQVLRSLADELTDRSRSASA